MCTEEENTDTKNLMRLRNSVVGSIILKGGRFKSAIIGKIALAKKASLKKSNLLLPFR